jgi:hypothetical protein
MVIRQRYVQLTRSIRSKIESTALGQRLESSDSVPMRHIRSLMAIYDLDAMVALDTPWWTYRSIRRVEDFIAMRDGQVRVYEYGSGASTYWLASRCSEVFSVDHDQEWFEQLSPRLTMDNVSLTHVPPVASSHPKVPSGRKGNDALDFEDYVTSINAVDGTFDLIVIDGRARTACLEHATTQLAPDGVVVFDNAARLRYRSTLAASPLEVDRLFGAAPSLPYPSCTALLSRPSG